MFSVNKWIAAVATATLVGATSSYAYDTTVDLGQYTLEFSLNDLSGPGSGFGNFGASGNVVGFSFNVPGSVFVGSNGSAAFVLPDFKVTANPGYALSGPVTGFIGNLVYFELGGGSTSASVTGNLAFDLGSPSAVGGPLVKTPSNPISGTYVFNGSTAHAGFNSMTFSGGSLTLNAGASAGITAQPQNLLSVSFIAAVVPEPENYGMLLVGLGLIGAIVRRRTRSGA